MRCFLGLVLRVLAGIGHRAIGPPLKDGVQSWFGYSAAANLRALFSQGKRKVRLDADYSGR